jgi:hypothetical protein
MSTRPRREPATSGEQILRQLDAHRTLAALHDPAPHERRDGWDSDPTPLVLQH